MQCDVSENILLNEVENIKVSDLGSGLNIRKFVRILPYFGFENFEHTFEPIRMDGVTGGRGEKGKISNTLS